MREHRYAALLLLFAVLLSAPLYSGYRAASAPPHEAATASGRAAPFPGVPVDINAAGVEELTAVPGIGVKTAERIVDRRAEIGPFKSLDDLLAVKYMSRAKIEKLRPYVAVN